MCFSLKAFCIQTEECSALQKPPRTSCLATGIVQTLRKPFCRNQIKKKEGNLSLRNLNILNYSICPDKFVSRLICAIALCIPTVLRFTRKVHAHIREQKISCFFFFFFFFSASKKNFHRHVNGFGDISFISLVCNRAKSSKKLGDDSSLRRSAFGSRTGLYERRAAL